MISQIIVPIAGTLLCYLLFHASQIIYCNLTSPLRHMVGPKNPSFVFGNFKDIGADPNLTNKWRNEFGANFLFSGLFSISELHTSDLKAVNHIVARPEIYQKAASNRASAQLLLGKGILSVELDEHKRHRRALNPAFGVAQIRAVTEIFVEKAVQLRDIWALQAEQQNGAACIEVLSWLRRMTLDVIGQAGFNYQFDALENNGKSNELDEVFTELFHSPQANMYNVFRLSQAIMPILRLMPGPGRNLLRAARNKMYIIGKQIVSKSKADIKAADGEESLIGKRDLLSILLKANLSTTIPETQRLNDTEVISEIPTFFFAGHETTSSATTWALHALSVNTAAQTKLREELSLTMSTDNPTMDELNSLPYLEHVVRETMRVHAPVMFTQRKAMKDDVLPLSKPYIDKEGRAHDSLPIPKGQMIHIPILAINTDKEIWGEDSTEFKPERWEKLPDAVSEIPGVWANLLTFFAGPHNCIGFRFSLVEMKALLFTLIRAFEFQQTVPKGGIGPFTGGVIQRPTVIGEGKGSGLPLIVKPYNMQLYP
ncbi:cytochrome P450 [Mycena olivaceomarginata]|nr:cytochrome P450 [Mycena olivaceomarginata]